MGINIYIYIYYWYCVRVYMYIHYILMMWNQSVRQHKQKGRPGFCFSRFSRGGCERLFDLDSVYISIYLYICHKNLSWFVELFCLVEVKPTIRIIATPILDDLNSLLKDSLWGKPIISRVFGLPVYIFRYIPIGSMGGMVYLSTYTYHKNQPCMDQWIY